MNIDLLLALFAGIFGLLVGSFSNVLIWRLPRGENIAFPPSHCPNCDHPLAPKDLVPLFSWLSLGGKCRYCRAPIKSRYPIVEAITGLAYALIALAFPLTVYGFAPIGLMFLFTILLAGSAIDIETFSLPDELTLTGVVLGLMFAALHGKVGVLPDFPEALSAALLSAGLLGLVNQLGSWVMRRFRERQWPEMPIGYQQISLGFLVGAWLGPVGALVAALLSAGVNLASRKVVRIPELLTLGGFIVSLVLSSAGMGRDIVAMGRGGLEGGGAVALVAGVYWWIANRNQPRTVQAQNVQAEADAPQDEPQEDPVAMGFGDWKLLAATGAFLGWQSLPVTFLASLVFGILFGGVNKLMGRGSKFPFGPALAAGALVAMFWGPQLTDWYKGLMHLPQ